LFCSSFPVVKNLKGDLSSYLQASSVELTSDEVFNDRLRNIVLKIIEHLPDNQ